jgi:hypothetical protein
MLRNVGLRLIRRAQAPAIAGQAIEVLTEALILAIHREIHSNVGLSILGQIIPHLAEEPKRALSAAALAQGSRNHDEVPCLRLLGESIVLLPEDEQEEKRSALAGRIEVFLDSQHSLDERSRLTLTPDLLPFMRPQAASRTALELAHAWKEKNPSAVSWLPKVVPFLPEPNRTDGARMLHDILVTSEERLVNNSLLEDARVWLDPEEFEGAVARLIEEAMAEPNARQRATELAALLKFAAPERQRKLSAYLLAEYQEHGERDDLWVNLLSRVIEAEDPQWVLENLFPLVPGVQHASRVHCVRLLCEIATRLDSQQRMGCLELANEILPLEHWPHVTILSAIPLLDRSSQEMLIVGILQDLAREGRVQHLKMAPHILPRIAEIGGAWAIKQSWEALWDATKIWP